MSVFGDSGNGSNEKNANVLSGEKNVLGDEHHGHLATHRAVVGDGTDYGAHVLEISQLGAEGQDLQTAPDGHTVLIPQPSSDLNDPLNWSPLKKHLTLLVISFTAFMPDFGSSMGIVTLLPQAM